MYWPGRGKDGRGETENKEETLIKMELVETQALIFGAGAVDATVTGLGAQAHLSLLAALSLSGVFFAPWPSAAALRIALE